MAYRKFFQYVLEHPEDFRLDFVQFEGHKPNLRKVTQGRQLLLEPDEDADIITPYAEHVGEVHKCQPPQIVGLGTRGGRFHTLPDGKTTISDFINQKVGPQKGKNARVWVREALAAVLGLMDEYIDSGHTMKVLAKQGDFLNLCGGVMVSRVGYNPVHALLLRLAGDGFTGPTYNSIGVDTGQLAENVKRTYLPRFENPDDWVVLFRNTGGEATNLAREMGKLVSGKPKRIGYLGSFHGRFDSVDINSFEFKIRFPDRLTQVSEDDSLEELETILRNHKNDREGIGVLMMEGVQGGACYLPKRPFYDEVRRLCEYYGVLFIMDLVQVNALTGSWNPVDEAESRKGAHIYALGKGFSEAYPLSGVLAPREFADKLKIGGWTSTHSMHWQGPTIAMGLFLVNEHLKETRGKDLVQYSRKQAGYFHQQLETMANRHQEAGVAVQHQGMKRGFMHSLRFKDYELAGCLVAELTKVGCYVFDAIPRGSYSTVKLFPPLLSTRAGLEEALFCIDHALKKANRQAR